MVAVALPLGVAALTVAMLRHSGLGRGWLELAAGIALISAVLYRPGIAFAHDGGILASASAMAMALVPGLVAAMLILRKWNWAGALAIGVASAGVVAMHPPQRRDVGPADAGGRGQASCSRRQAGRGSGNPSSRWRWPVCSR
jgi:hypothetical protein